MFCKNCGNQVEENQKFCPFCGANLQEDAAQEAEPIQTETLYAEPVAPKERKLNVGLLVWSIINTAMCCTPLGVVSLIMTILAKNASTDEDENGKLKTAKICNLIGSIGGFIISIISFVVGFLSAFAEVL